MAFLRSFVLGVFQGLQKELSVHQNDIQAALDHCHEAVMEIEITNFLQVIMVLLLLLVPVSLALHSGSNYVIYSINVSVTIPI